MNGQVRAGRTTAGRGRVAAAVASLGIATLGLGVVAGSAVASDAAGPVRVTSEVGAGPATAVTPGAACAGDALVVTFPRVGSRHAAGTTLAV